MWHSVVLFLHFMYLALTQSFVHFFIFLPNVGRVFLDCVFASVLRCHTGRQGQTEHPNQDRAGLWGSAGGRLHSPGSCQQPCEPPSQHSLAPSGKPCVGKLGLGGLGLFLHGGKHDFRFVAIVKYRTCYLAHTNSHTSHPHHLAIPLFMLFFRRSGRCRSLICLKSLRERLTRRN